MRILVTGGAGFIGSHIVDALIERGHEVWVYDNLDPQVHGPNATLPDYANPHARYLWGDVCDRDSLKKAVVEVDVIYHKAAAVGVGQSMYEILRYTRSNTLGGATLLDILANESHHVRKLIVASSMTVYGEGEYRCPTHGSVYPKLRPVEQLAQCHWEVLCPHCHQVTAPIPTSEEKPLFPTSIYAMNKRDHEEMFLSVGRAYDIPTVALRYFNAYGPRQALSNPYTGVTAIFSGRLLNGKAPVIYEDGLQSRDFIHVSDIVQANMLALEKEEANDQVFNVGTGRKLTIRDVAVALSDHMGVEIAPEIVSKFRKGDIRHCYADIGKAQTRLGYQPQVQFEEGIVDLVGWVGAQTAEDHLSVASGELEKRGLLHSTQ